MDRVADKAAFSRASIEKRNQLREIALYLLTTQDRRDPAKIGPPPAGTPERRMDTGRRWSDKWQYAAGTAQWTPTLFIEDDDPEPPPAALRFPSIEAAIERHPANVVPLRSRIERALRGRFA
jgi:hypothetical protein